MAPTPEQMRTATEQGSDLRQRKAAGSAVSGRTENSSDNVFTWREVAEHNTSNSCWMVINNVVYDCTEWVDKHPGGREFILIHAGRECTNTFESYHPFSSKPHQILKKFAIGKLDTSDSEFPPYQPDSGMYKTMRQRVGAYFRENNLNPKDPLPGLWRMLLVFAAAAFAYCCMNGIIEVGIGAKYACAVLFGVCQALPLLHVMHDSSHAAYSSSSVVWTFVGRFAMDWYAGGSMVSWLYQHVVGHHIYTNVAGADPDLPVDFKGDIRRIVERQVLKPLYAYQHYYLPPLYGLLGLKFRLQDFLETFINLTNGPVRVNPHSFAVWMALLLSKAFWVFYRIWIPLAVLGVAQAEYWKLFLVAEFVTGWYLAFNFQVSHVSTECDYPAGDKPVKEIQDEWAVSQIKSSVDYAHGSALVAFFSGALNYQTTHHLFPCVSQYHYPAIAPIIMQVCKEYKVQYNVTPTFAEALMNHFIHLREMGKSGKPVTVHMG